MNVYDALTNPVFMQSTTQGSGSEFDLPLPSTKKRKGGNPFKNWKVLLTILVLLAIGWLILSSHSTGSRVGKIVKFSKKGVLWKSYEGTLQVGDQASLTWDFSVQDSKVAKEVQRALEGQQNVRLEYKEYYFNWSPAETLYDITKVTPVQ